MVNAKIDVRGVESGIRDMLRRAENVGPFFTALKPELRKDQTDHAREQEGPSGDWPSWSSSYERKAQRKRGRRGRGRRKLGRLPKAVNYRSRTDSVEAESRVRWSGVHQDGGRVGNGADVPQRTFLWFSNDFLEDATEALLAYAAKVW